MAFYFLVEDGEALPNANSYVTVEYADDYVESNPYKSEKWLALEEEVKQRWLVRASKQLDVRYKWFGYKTDPNSGLKWPRTGVTLDGCPLGSNFIPPILMDATVEFATYLMESDWTAPRENDQFKEIQVDVIDLKFDTDYRRSAIPPTIDAMLLDLGFANSGSGKVGFKPVIRH